MKKNEVIFRNKIGFSFIFDSLNRKSKKELIKRLIDTIEIKRDKNYNIEITNVKFTEEFISKSSKDYIEYLYEILRNNNVGFIYKEAITKQELEKLQEDYFVFSNTKISNGEYDNATLTIYNELLKFFFEVERRRMKKASTLALEGKNVILDRCALSTVAISYAFEKLGKYPTFNHALRSI